MILAINPGSTSTKIAAFDGEKEIFCETLRHSTKVLDECGGIIDQKTFRKDEILRILEEKKIDLNKLDAVVGRGGLIRPVESGTYLVNEKMLNDLESCKYGTHACNLAGIIANEISTKYKVPAYVVDPPTVDEMAEIAKYTGIPEIKRVSKFHALNQKAVAKRYAKTIGKPYEELNLIVAHMGGGISIAAHCKGRVIDTTNGSDGDGPFSTNRVGSLAYKPIVELCFSGEYSKQEILSRITSTGGMNAYLGSNDMREIEQMKADGNELAAAIIEAYIYQVSKYIGAMATALCGEVNQIILTGGIAYDNYIVEKIGEVVTYIAPVTVYPGEDEMSALANGVLRVLNAEEELKAY